MSIEWPDIKFPPVNLHTIGRMWPDGYLVLEQRYTASTLQDYIDATGILKERRRSQLQHKKEEFNRLWNERAENIC